MDSTPITTFVEGFQPGYLGRIAQMHGEFYASEWGSGVGFEAVMARELAEFFERYNPNTDLLLTAHVDGKIVGSMAVDGNHPERPGLARLRWFLIEAGYHGRGIGRFLFDRALGFCRLAGFPMVYLWTAEGLPESLHMYQKAGFQIVDREVSTQYTVELRHLMMELPLAMCNE